MKSYLDINGIYYSKNDFGPQLIILIIKIDYLNIITFKQKYIFDILGKNVNMGFVFLRMFVSVKVDLAGRIALNVRTKVYFLFIVERFLYFFDLKF